MPTVACVPPLQRYGIAARVGNTTPAHTGGPIRFRPMPALLPVLAAVFGATSAAFLPRVAHRLAVAFGRPHRATCAACGRRFPAGPAGWVRVGAACPCSRAYAVTTLTGAAVATMLAVALGPSPLLPVFLLAAVPGLLLAVIDLRCRRLPDRLVGALAITAGVPLAVLRPERIGPALVAGGLVLTAYVLVALIPRGVGLGDVKLAAVLAFVLGFAGWPAVAVGMVAPYLIIGPVALAVLISGRDRSLPFGPALLAGALIALTAA